MALKLQSANIPLLPGIYIFSAKSKVLYVGKATNLRSRLRYYLNVARLPAPNKESLKLSSLLKEARSLAWEILNSETEALIREAELIKKHRPKYNVLMRDDKRYFYVGFSKEKFSKIFVTHQPTGVGADFIGPFTEGGSLRSVLKTLRRIFPYCTCLPRREVRVGKRPHLRLCLNARIGKCLGFCCSTEYQRETMSLRAVSEDFGEVYQKNIKAIKKILSGKNKSLVNELKKEMQKLSKAQKYEEAGKVRNQIFALKKIFEHRGVIQRDLPTENAKAIRSLEIILKTSSINRIEAYDIANIHGKFAYGSMAVLENGKLAKNEYRLFKIRTVTGSNDTAMIKEVLSRRFKHPEWTPPQVIIIDGGKAQFNAVLHETRSISETRRSPTSFEGGLPAGEAGLSAKKLNGFRDIKILALTKNEKHVGDHIFINGASTPLVLSSLPRQLTNLILHLDSEAHRFAISHYRKLHRKELIRYPQ